MSKLKPLFGIAALLILSLTLAKPDETIGEAKEELSIAQKQERSRKYLMSLDHPGLSVSDSEINYSVRLHKQNEGEIATYSSEEGAANLMLQTTIDTLPATVAGANLLGLFIDAYLGSLGDLSKVVKHFTKDEYVAIDCLTQKSFMDKLDEFSQGIITFWNSDGDITQGAHTVYVKKKSFTFFSL